MEEHFLNICSSKVLEMINLDQILILLGKEILEKIKLEKTPVIFISGHFSNFELMAMEIEKSGINLSAIYRPLNNIFLNVLMERIRKKYICKNQIKKGTSGVRELLRLYKKGVLYSLNDRSESLSRNKI